MTRKCILKAICACVLLCMQDLEGTTSSVTSLYLEVRPIPMLIHVQYNESIPVLQQWVLRPGRLPTPPPCAQVVCSATTQGLTTNLWHSQPKLKNISTNSASFTINHV